MKRVLVCDAGGFIGSHLVNELKMGVGDVDICHEKTFLAY